MLSRPTFLHTRLYNITQGKRPTECGTGRRHSSATARNRFNRRGLGRVHDRRGFRAETRPIKPTPLSSHDTHALRLSPYVPV